MENLVANSQATIVDITVENFQQIIIEASQDKLVLIDFWADWCEPCKDLMPILEKLAGEYSQHLILAKVDCEAQQEVAAQFGIRSLPTVMVVQNGQPVDGFAGVQPEQQIREMLAKYLPNPEDDLLATAGKAIQQGDYAEALPAAKEALALNPDNVNAKYMLIDCYIETGSIDTAKALLEEIKLVDQDSRYKSLAGKIEVAEQAADTPEVRVVYCCTFASSSGRLRSLAHRGNCDKRSLPRYGLSGHFSPVLSVFAFSSDYVTNFLSVFRSRAFVFHPSFCNWR